MSETELMPRPAEFSPADNSVELALEVETHIWELEGRLFDHDPAQRLFETRHYIPEVFQKAAVILGEPAQPERMMGHERWAAWLEARLTTRAYGNQRLTPGFIRELYAQSMQRIDPKAASQLRDKSGRTGSSLDSDGALRPLVCTDQQLDVIDTNPYLRFDPRFPGNPEYYDLGFVEHHVPPEQIEFRLIEICTEYNIAVRTGADPFYTAARLQQRLSSLQPFGTGDDIIAHALQSWSLENAGLIPVPPLNAAEEVTLSTQQLTEKARNGYTESLRFVEYVNAGETDPVKLLGVSRERALLATESPHYTYAIPRIVQAEESPDHFRYTRFMDALGNDPGRLLATFNDEFDTRPPIISSLNPLPDRWDTKSRLHVALQPSQLHEPDAINAFVDANTNGKALDTQFLQLIGVKTLQHPELLDRFLKDFQQAVHLSSVEPHLFVLDDSWDDDAARATEAIAEKHGVDYHRIRDPDGLVTEIMNAVLADIESNATSFSQKQYFSWLARAVLRDQMAVSLEVTSDPSERGGVVGNQNIGYLVALYEAGKRQIPPDDAAITINEDDQRYMTVTDQDGSLELEHHDFFGERQAWLRDPSTMAIAGRYAGHSGNPIGLADSTIRVCSTIMRDRIKGESRSFSIFDSELDRFVSISSAEAYERIPEIIQGLMERRPSAGWQSKEENYESHFLDLFSVSKLYLGNLTLRGSVVTSLPVPPAGFHDHSLRALLQARALEDHFPNRTIRREESLLHQREVRPNGGDALGAGLADSIVNPYLIDHSKIAYVIERDRQLRRELVETLGLVPEVVERMASGDITKIDRCREGLQQLDSLRTQLGDATDEAAEQSISNLYNYLSPVLAEAEEIVKTPPDEATTVLIRRGIRRYLAAYKIWPRMAAAAYRLGYDQSRQGV